MDDMTTMFFDAMMYAMEGEDPSKAIENQERRGQQSVVRNQRLPKEIKRPFCSTRSQMERCRRFNGMGRKRQNCYTEQH